jgi:hypothetical protein
MACMHKETFEIFHNDQNILPDGYVEIDELMAPIIQILNRKGYITRFCCSGHPLDDWLMVENGELRETMNLPRCYIAFAKDIILPVLPSDFVLNTNNPTLAAIEKVYYIDNAFDNQFYERVRSILETMKQLYEWALDLPNFKPE